MARETITRNHLPHWYVPGAVHFVTYRLAGTIPLAVLQELRHQQQTHLKQPPRAGMSPAEHKERIHKQFFAAYDQYLDHTCMIDWLGRPEIAAIIRRNLYYHNSSKYHLLAYCIMPNHVHVLLQPIDPTGACPAKFVGQAGLLVPFSDEVSDGQSPLATIMHCLKSYTANKANELLGQTGQFWQHESYDHWVRDDQELERIVTYIAHNPVEAKLVAEPYLWFFSSAHDRFLLDGGKEGWLGDSP